MKFASAKQAIVLIILTCAGLYALDYYKNPQLWHHESKEMEASGKGARLVLWMNHLCCTGCLSDIRQALASVAGVDLANATAPRQLLTQEQANTQSTSLADYGAAVELPITDLDKLDLVTIDRALRDKGFVAGRIELGGAQHFRLEAGVDHLCCGMCDRAIHERVQFLKSKGLGGQFKWLDSVSVDHERKTVIAYARFLEPGKTADVGEFLSGLNYLGYEPHAMRVVLVEHMQHPIGTTAH
jgi:hypothetical protein